MDLVTHVLGRIGQVCEKRLAVAGAADSDVMAAVQAAVGKGLIQPLLSGDPAALESAAAALDFDISAYTILPADTPEAAAREAVAAVSDGRADALMKGLVPTSVLMRAVLDKSHGIRGEGLLSHLAVFLLPVLNRPIFLTDSAISIAPDLKAKAALIENAVGYMKNLGYDNPVVGILAAIETVNPAMPATLDAAALVDMQRAGQISGCRVGGPYALDNALFATLAKKKGMTDPLAGHADLLLAPDIEAGNVLNKALSLLAGGENAGLVIGARAPIVLTSRSDSRQTKLNSIALALAGCHEEATTA